MSNVVTFVLSLSRSRNGEMPEASMQETAKILLFLTEKSCKRVIHVVQLRLNRIERDLEGGGGVDAKGIVR